MKFHVIRYKPYLCELIYIDMRQEGHIGLALLLIAPITTLLIYFGNLAIGLVFTGIVVWFSTFPDVDIKLQKWTGKNGIPIVRNIITITHRGITHSVWFAIGCGLIVSSISLVVTSNIYISGIIFTSGFLGVTLHSVGDIVTPAGVDYKYTSDSDKKSLNWFKFNNLIANIGFGLLGILSMIIAILIGVNGYTIYLILLFVSLYIVVTPIVIKLAQNLDYEYTKRSHKLTKYTRLRHWLK